MRCSSCGAENSEGLKFCNECGAPFKRRCGACGFENIPTTKFCGECAAPLNPLANRSEPTKASSQQPVRLAQMAGSDARPTAQADPPAIAEGERKTVTALFAGRAEEKN